MKSKDDFTYHICSLLEENDLSLYPQIELDICKYFVIRNKKEHLFDIVNKDMYIYLSTLFYRIFHKELDKRYKNFLDTNVNKKYDTLVSHLHLFKNIKNYNKQWLKYSNTNINFLWFVLSPFYIDSYITHIRDSYITDELKRLYSLVSYSSSKYDIEDLMNTIFIRIIYYLENSDYSNKDIFDILKYLAIVFFHIRLTDKSFVLSILTSEELGKVKYRLNTLF